MWAAPILAHFFIVFPLTQKQKLEKYSASCRDALGIVLPIFPKI